MPDFTRAAAVMTGALAARAFPGAIVEVGRASGPIWQQSFGRLRYEGDAPPATSDTIYDLASLTKVLATTSLVMRLVDQDRLDLDEPLSARWPGWRAADRAAVSVADLLAHRSGLCAWLPLYESCTGRRDFEQAILSLPLEYPRGSRSVYSDLGFILLGFVIEDLFERPLAELVEREILAPLSADGAGTLRFLPPDAWRSRIAPTEVEPWRGRLLAGEVHDANAWALGGVAGHAGLFGTAGAVGAIARSLLDSRRGGRSGRPQLAQPATVTRFTRRAGPEGSSRGLGWDMMLPTSSCGRRMSVSAFGHTGFTGTSAWIDPDADLYVVLLSNRVHPDRTNEGIAHVRPALHDAVMEDLGRR